jgi:hypothetical protein
VYDLDQDESQELAPNGSCCYRDAHWSPDGTYLFYSYQPEPGGDVSLFYAPTASLSQPGESWPPWLCPPASSLAALNPSSPPCAPRINNN